LWVKAIERFRYWQVTKGIMSVPVLINGGSVIKGGIEDTDAPENQVRTGLTAGAKRIRTFGPTGHGELSCRVILLGCLGYVGALETAAPPTGANNRVSRLTR